MREYLPWSKVTLRDCIRDYKEGRFTILDLELSGACNYTCKYCDSPDRNKCFSVDTDILSSVLQDKQIKWIFICGLGEPTFGINYEKLIEILEISKQKGIKCSIFTNLSFLTKDLLEYIDQEVLYILFKLDSFKEDYIKKFYGTNNAINQLDNISELVKHVIIRNGCTNIAASIVPNRYNKDEIPEIVSWCSEHDVFPLIAELEEAGKGELIFDELRLSKEELAKIKLDILLKNAEEPRVPICPAMISGIHINNSGDITVDEATGFSCHWFWLKNPAIKRIGTLTGTTKWEEYSQKIIDYRLGLTKSIVSKIDSFNDEGTVFGGCGGSVRDLLLSHVALHKESK